MADYLDSRIGYTAGTLTSTAGALPNGNSLIGYKTSTLQSLQNPIVVFTATGLRRTSLKMYNGSSWK